MNASRVARAALIASLAAAAAWVAACNAITGLDKYKTGGAAACGTTRYVSTSGDDTHDGCTPQTARKTIKASIGDVTTIGRPGYTIEVCAGTYPEADLAVSFPLALRGGYDCTSWQQTATHDYPGLDRANETIITNASPDTTHIATLQFGQPPAGASDVPVVDGFTIQGADNLDTSFAVRFLVGSAGTLSNCRIDGGDATTLTVGVDVLSNAAEVTGDNVHAGKAVTSQGIQVNLMGAPAPGPKVHDLTIVTGVATAQSTTGVLSTGSGVVMTESAGTPLKGLFISAGSGSPAVGVGVYNGASADVIGSVIQAGTQITPAGDAGASEPGVAGVNVSQAASGAVRVIGNRIYSGGVTMGYGDYAGVIVFKTSGVVIANNMIYGGYNGPNAPKEVGNAHAVHISTGSNDTVVVDNTLYTGLSGGGDDATTVRTAAGVTGTVFRNNILAGIGGADFGITMDDCTMTEFAAVEHNLFVGQGLGVARSNGCSSGGETVIRDLAKIGNLLGSTPIDGNVTMRSSCDGGVAVCLPAPACPTPIAEGGSTTCMEGLFVGWTAFDNGYTTLLDGGWMLAPGNPCPVMRGGLPLDDASPPVSLDFYGHARGPTPSMGAAQSDAGCD